LSAASDHHFHQIINQYFSNVTGVREKLFEPSCWALNSPQVEQLQCNARVLRVLRVLKKPGNSHNYEYTKHPQSGIILL
jgi:hypothetical protein